MSRTTIVIILLIYCVSVFFTLGAVSSSIPSVEYNYTGQTIGAPIKFLGMEIDTGQSLLGNVVTGIANMPIWFNVIFIAIPSVLLAIFTILMFIPTIPSG